MSLHKIVPKLIVVSLFAFLFSSCKTIEQQKTEKVSWLLSKGFMAEVCTTLYPSVDYQVRTKTDTIYADNEDYTKQIANLQYRLDSIGVVSQTDSLRVASSYEECKLVIQQKDGQIKVIQAEFALLKNKYRPCNPTVIHDSVFINTVDGKQVNYLRSEIIAKDAQIKQKDDIIINQQKNLDKDDWWKYAFFVLAGVNILAIVFRIFVLKKPI